MTRKLPTSAGLALPIGRLPASLALAGTSHDKDGAACLRLWCVALSAKSA